MSTSPVRLSANLGFLWTELDLPDAVRAAAAAGFAAVECHVVQDGDPGALRDVLDETGLPLVGLNTRAGDDAEGAAGLAALPGRGAEARAVIDEAVAYAGRVGCGNVHVMAGKAAGSAARATFVENLAYAAKAAHKQNVSILIEPINQRNMPGYFLSEMEVAAGIISEVEARLEPVHHGVVRIMFDCYHVQIGQGDLLRRFEAHLPLIGHVQFASVPDRSEPDEGEVDYGWLLPRLFAAGYDGFAGAEYRPRDDTESGIGWLAAFG